MPPAAEEFAVDDLDEFESRLDSFLNRFHADDLRRILLPDPDGKLHFPLVIDFAELLEFDPEVAHQLYDYPKDVLELFDAAAQRALDKFDAAARRADKRKAGDETMEKKFVHVRVNTSGSALECPEASPSIGKVRVKHRGTLLTLKGTVIRSGGVKMIEGERKYQCRKCKCRFTVHPELEAGNRITLPASCKSKSAKGCGGANFQLIEDSITCHDYQEIKIQENIQLLGVGSIPRSMPIILMDDLVDIVKAGDDVVVTGRLSAKWSPDIKDVRSNLDPMLIANFVRRTNELKSDLDIPVEIINKFEEFWAASRATPLKGRNSILKGICPQIYGLFTVKLAVALTLIGGVQHVDASGTKVRGEPHMLLVGDPGTGKSQFLKFAAKLSNRSVITTGLGSTSAGLTVTAVKDGGEWMLEAGALVLADGGLCCIDEFDSMREHDRTTIHEAMEQQTISIAKAGLVTTLNTRTTVFGATNPKGQYDPNESLSVNTTLSGPLLSRFDIVLVLLDTKNKKWDKIVSSHILAENTEEKKGKTSDPEVMWTLSMLRRYIHYVKQHFKPVLTKEAERVISSYYQRQRQSGTRNAARTTVRMLESLIRLAQAHARLMFRNCVTKLDAIAAILCIESSMTTSAIVDTAGNALHSNFTENPDQECILKCDSIAYLSKNIKYLTDEISN
ncbi:probable DNA helicase MCM9 isoform X1 [Oryza glaberrima]|uniref:Probable DNA helicase MCM9 n=1 Tax=Oryza glaberrima TaxID=4538 RepID=I1Q0P7_ORYGL|nr:probable DNA helicase MCM9 isoform X1 [Oryza glaberrima]XP_052158486.1 probable DNA helicase MCM9 isoform X1 [Oryza glaberrima]